MKTLTLLRHAKSGWDDPVTRDFDRPLNGKGKRAAQTVGRHLRDLGLEFDHVVASPAIRVGETLDAVGAGYGRALTPVWERRIYLASAATLLDVVHDLPGDAARVLMVGHNPGLEDLVLMLVPAAGGGEGLRGLVEQKYPTATLAEMTLDIAGWDEAGAGGATLTRYVRPRDLDASLGPDED
ncbi:histidine phosphatase family protein [Sphingomonas sp. A2-49]|uniref:SixA phosphatase family protein n=1 Tax=Sphingomonas sp. A2-49 TaxID=1391375 RepID=UPI0021CF725C|nr:histidine phosphatase family protein [Sphingomonas sp. A2-49]MCU6454888.1 histidine phosphatase family protein [Sphingomonas sp. A2-49]